MAIWNLVSVYVLRMLNIDSAIVLRIVSWTKDEDNGNNNNGDESTTPY